MIRLFPLFALVATPALAEVPRVLTDIAPVHSLTAMVMGDLGTPDLLLAPGTSPHDYSFRPSEAEALSQAQLVVWVGHGLTPWLEEPVETLASGAVVLELSETAGWTPLAFRQDAAFAHGDHEEHQEHDEHEDHAAGEDHDAHAQDGADPHAWLDPSIAAVWATAIAEALATQDPENAATYRANAARAGADLAALKTELQSLMAPVRGKAFVTPHDAYQYFETAFDLPAAGAIALGDAARPGPTRIAEIKDRIAAENIACVLTDTQTNPDWIVLVTEGTAARTAPIDDIGAAYQPGPALYPALLRAIAASLSACLGG